MSSWITWLLFGTIFFKFLLFSKLSFAKQYTLDEICHSFLNVRANYCKQLNPVIFLNASWIISDRNCKKWRPGVATGKDLLSHFNTVCSSTLPQLIMVKTDTSGIGADVQPDHEDSTILNAPCRPKKKRSVKGRENEWEILVTKTHQKLSDDLMQ
jgi:hypothetical protein